MNRDLVRNRLVLLSGGSYKFHMAPLAAELQARNLLCSYITAGWPIGIQEKIARLFPLSQGWKRFLDRKENIDEKYLCSQPAVEVILKLGDIFFAKRSKYLQQSLHKLAFTMYSRRAATMLRNKMPGIYHYRDCYGGNSVSVAKSLGIPSLCDHSIAHPIFLHHMEGNAGSWPTEDDIEGIKRNLLPLERSMLDDLNLADYLLVNSDFVKETCVRAGWPEENVYVVYLGIDEAFQQHVQRARDSKVERKHSKNILFAGGWQQRKGVQTLANALSVLSSPWELTIAGGKEASVLADPCVRDLLARPNVHDMGVLTRARLAELMCSHDIFVFPSYCEGSARVVFEAMSAGCFVITTPNSGSIVKDGENGFVVPPGNVDALAKAIQAAISDPELVSRIGRNNQALVSEAYQQRDYGRRVEAVYRDIFSRPPFPQ